MILKNLLRRKTRTFLTLVGIAIGVAAVVAMGAMAEGFINSYTTILTSSGADVIVTQSDAADILFSAVDDTVAPQLANVPGVSQVSGALVGMITTPDVPYFIIMGIEPSTFGMSHYKVTEGQISGGSTPDVDRQSGGEEFQEKRGRQFQGSRNLVQNCWRV